MKTRFPLWAAIGLVVLWTGMGFAVYSTIELFADFNLEMPALTFAVFWVFGLLEKTALPMLVLATAILLGLRQFLGWVYALVLCLAWNLAFAGLFLRGLSLIERLTGMSKPIFSESLRLLTGSDGGYFLALCALLLNQILLVTLVVKRARFVR